MVATLINRSLSTRRVDEENIYRILNDQLIPIVRNLVGLVNRHVWTADIPEIPEGREEWTIGSIMIRDDSQNPADVLGYGIWELMSSGRVLVGYDAADSDFNAVGKEGGAKEHDHEVDDHNHSLNGHQHSETQHIHGHAHTHTVSADHYHSMNHKHGTPVGASSGVFYLLNQGAVIGSALSYCTLVTSSGSGVSVSAFPTSNTDTSNTGNAGSGVATSGASPAATGFSSASNTGAAWGNTGNTQPGTNSVSNQMKYRTEAMWKRIA